MLLAEIERALGGRGAVGRLIVACSGGMDSVALASACVELLGGRRVLLGHVDHAVRPGSDMDGEFVESLGRTLGVPVRVLRVAPQSDAEAELRRVRYDALEKLRLEEEADHVLTAHTLDDQAETVLLQLIRTGHISGIPERRGAIVRPWLAVPREVVRRYAERRGLSWREDPTNREPRYLRNRIRKELLPLLARRYNPQIRSHLARSRSDAPAVSSGKVVQPEMSLQHPQEASAHLEAAKRMLSLPPDEMLAALEAELGQGCPVVQMRRAAWTAEGTIPDGRKVAVFDAAFLEHPAVRTPRAGDRIRGFGMMGRTKVMEVLRAAGVPAAERRSWPLVVDGADQVIWVPGVLRSAHAPVDARTREVWILEVREIAVLQATESQVTLDPAPSVDGETPAAPPRKNS